MKQSVTGRHMARLGTAKTIYTIARQDPDHPVTPENEKVYRNQLTLAHAVGVGGGMGCIIRSSSLELPSPVSKFTIRITVT